jgi:hypothetical protein
MDLREIGLGGVNWIRLAQDRGQWRAVGGGGDEPLGSCATELVFLQVYYKPYQYISGIFPLSSYNVGTALMLYLQL